MIPALLHVAETNRFLGFFKGKCTGRDRQRQAEDVSENAERQNNHCVISIKVKDLGSLVYTPHPSKLPGNVALFSSVTVCCCVFTPSKSKFCAETQPRPSPSSENTDLGVERGTARASAQAPCFCRQRLRNHTSQQLTSRAEGAPQRLR